MKREFLLKLSLSQKFRLQIKNLADSYADLLSFILDEKINVGNAFRIAHAVIAFTFLVFSYGNALCSVIFMIWFILTLISCKRAGIK